jgi:hypothetical protein
MQRFKVKKKQNKLNHKTPPRIRRDGSAIKYTRVAIRQHTTKRSQTHARSPFNTLYSAAALLPLLLPDLLPALLLDLLPALLPALLSSLFLLIFLLPLALDADEPASSPPDAIVAAVSSTPPSPSPSPLLCPLAPDMATSSMRGVSSGGVDEVEVGLPP